MQKMLFSRDIRTLDFSRNTSDAVLSGLQIVDIGNQIIFQKIATLQQQGPPFLM